MPIPLTDPFGNEIKACSISTMVKAKFGKDAFASEAAWSKQVKHDAYNVLRAKIKAGDVPKNTVVARTADGRKLVYKGGDDLDLVAKYGGQTAHATHSVESFDGQPAFNLNDWDFGPNMATMAQAQKAIVDSPAKLKKFIMEDPAGSELNVGDKVASVKFKTADKTLDVHYGGTNNSNPFYSIKENGKDLTTWSQADLEIFTDKKFFDVEYKVGQIPPEMPVAHGLPVSSTSKSVGALTNEDAATMFVKTKDKLAAEQGINIKGANPALDHLVYKTIADQAGYTPGEMMAKVEAYKASGKKLSSLKKKVLPKSGNPTKVATDKAVDKAAQAVLKETPKPEDVPKVWNSEEVAKAYVKAKDKVVANNEHGWTLYTQKNPAFDKAILEEMQKTLGPIKQETADTAIADYIANHQKLSVLKKQMIKSGEMEKAADTLKGAKAGAGAGEPVVKVAPKETGAGQVGKATEDPKLVAPKHELSDEQKIMIKDSWEGANLPLSSSGEKIYGYAKLVAKQEGLGDDVLPILRWVDEYKAQKFGVPNANLYEKKVNEYLKNPKPAGYTSSVPHVEPGKVFGELPEDSAIFEEISHHTMTSIFNSSMKRPTSEQAGAIRTYTGSTYHEINGHIRQGGSVMTQRYARHIQEAMSPLPRDITVRRGTSLKALGFNNPDELAGAIGKTFREPAFSSTAVGGSGQFSGEVNLVIQAPKGTSAVWARPYSGIQHENELILSAGTRFQILKVEQRKTGWSTTNVVHVRVIGAAPK